jgi:hypothetical protein
VTASASPAQFADTAADRARFHVQRPHSNAWLTFSGRRALVIVVERIETVTAATTHVEVSRTTFHRRRPSDADGDNEFHDRSSASRCLRKTLDAGRLKAVRHPLTVA